MGKLLRLFRRLWIGEFERKVLRYMDSGLARVDAERLASEEVNQCYIHA